jgi:hypothetical protein
MAIRQTKIKQMLMRVQRTGTVDGNKLMQRIMENSMEIPQKARESNPTSGCVPKGKEISISATQLHCPAG